ncbi:MAG: SDR family NAD(P)-dependent oxidoreductase, partial [candidate division WOR-3 bacterium]
MIDRRAAGGGRLKRWPGTGRVALVTGASSGIGLAIARKFAAGGLKVVLVARRKERLATIAGDLEAGGADVIVVPADLALEAERERVCDEVRQSYGMIDVLVNNAGLGWYGYGYRMPWHVAREMLRVNVEAAVHLTLLCLPAMKSRGSGHVINIGSIAGCLPEQGIGIYGATKAFLDAFTTSLYRELRGSGVWVSVVRAGPVATEFFEAARRRPAGWAVPAQSLAISPEQVADRVWWLVRHPRRQVFVPCHLRLATWL